MPPPSYWYVPLFPSLTFLGIDFDLFSPHTIFCGSTPSSTTSPSPPPPHHPASPTPIQIWDPKFWVYSLLISVFNFQLFFIPLVDVHPTLLCCSNTSVLTSRIFYGEAINNCILCHFLSCITSLRCSTYCVIHNSISYCLCIYIPVLIQALVRRVCSGR